MSIRVEQVNKRFGQFVALNSVSIDFAEGELTALLGPSGCGKTTLLRMIAGLEQPDSGKIFLHEHHATHLSAGERQVGFVFQHYALFRHMKVFDNVAFGLRMKPKAQRLSESAIHDKVMALLKMVQLDWLADRYPAQLSGGQRQRIALARALAVEPKVLLLDEPFGALDAKVRQELRQWLRRLHDELGMTSIFVTHDQEEALEVSDRIVVMNHGNVEQIGTPQQVYDTPANAFVYGFLGVINRFQGQCVALPDAQQGQAESYGFAYGEHVLPLPASMDNRHIALNQPVQLIVRSHDWQVIPVGGANDLTANTVARDVNATHGLPAVIQKIQIVATHARIQVQVAGWDTFEIEVHRHELTGMLLSEMTLPCPVVLRLKYAFLQPAP
jgi:sulfate transport system ATP-binding protein